MIGCRTILVALLLFAGLAFPAGGETSVGAVPAAGEQARSAFLSSVRADLESDSDGPIFLAAPLCPPPSQECAEGQEEEHLSSLAVPTSEIARTVSRRLRIREAIAAPSCSTVATVLPRGPPALG